MSSGEAYFKSRAYKGKNPAVSMFCFEKPAFAVYSTRTIADEKSSAIKTYIPFSRTNSLTFSRELFFSIEKALKTKAEIIRKNENSFFFIKVLFI